MSGVHRPAVNSVGYTDGYTDSLSYELDLADAGLTDGLVWVDGAALADDDLECEAADQVVAVLR